MASYSLQTALIICLLAAIAPANAQDNKATSTDERIAIAFYKTAGLIPPYVSWVKAQKPYNLTPLARRANVLDQETKRLAKLYQDFSPKRDVLTIRTNMALTPSSELDALGEQTLYFLSLDMGRPVKDFYLPYQYNGQNFMVVPTAFDRFQKFPITKDEFDRITTMRNPTKKMPITISLVTRTADITQPYMIDNMPQWVMSADIVSIESWTNNGHLVWQYTTSGFLPEKMQEIQKLYQE